MHFFRSLIGSQSGKEGFVTRRLIHNKNTDYNGHNTEFADYLVKTPLAESDFAKTTDQKGEYALVFNDYLQASYKGGELDSSVIMIEGPYALFDHNGIILNPQNVTMEGSWGDRRLPELLPVDYEPGSL
jgi:hypothetical protein